MAGLKLKREGVKFGTHLRIVDVIPDPKKIAYPLLYKLEGCPLAREIFHLNLKTVFQ